MRRSIWSCGREHVVDARARPRTRSAIAPVSSAFGRARPGTSRAARRLGGALDQRGLVAEDPLELLVRVSLLRKRKLRPGRSLMDRRARTSTSAICCSLASTFMKISSSTPFFHCSVPWSTTSRAARCRRTANSDTATVMMPANVISRLRRSEIQRLAREVARVATCAVSSRRRRRRAPGRARACRGRARSRGGAWRRRCAGRGWP